MMDEDEPVAVALNQTTYQIIIDPAVTEKEGIKRALDFNKIYLEMLFKNVTFVVGEELKADSSSI